MRIRGFLNRDYEPPAPFIKVLLISKDSNIRKFLDLHIDTGASSTIILDKDARYIGLDIKSLKKAKRNIGGIGGLIDTYLSVNKLNTVKQEILHASEVGNSHEQYKEPISQELFRKYCRAYLSPLLLQNRLARLSLRQYASTTSCP
jgi:hypothetical protein